MRGTSCARGSWVMVAALLGSPGLAQEEAQPIRPLRTAQALGMMPPLKEKPLDRLRQIYYESAEDATVPLSQAAADLLKELEVVSLRVGDPPPRCIIQEKKRLDLEHGLLRLVMVDADSGTLISFFVGPGVDPHGGDVLVRDRRAPFCQVFLSAAPYTSFRSTYRFVREENPLLSLIPAAVGSLDLLRPLAETLVEEEEPKPVVWAQIDEIPIPFSRASVSLTEKAETEVSPDPCALDGDANTLADRLTKRHKLFCSLAGDLAEAMRRRLSCEVTEPCRCNAGHGSPASRWSELDRQLSMAYADIGGGDGAEAHDCAEALLDVDRGFRALVTPPEPAVAEAEAEFRIHPLERWSLGVASAAIFETWNAEDRAKLEDNVLAADPLTGALLLTVVNVHPWAYDPGRSRMSLAEQFRVFAGAAVAPHWGPAVGVGFAPFKDVRGLSLSAGLALLRIERVPSGKEFGDEAESLRSGWGRAFFVGLAYNFEP